MDSLFDQIEDIRRRASELAAGLSPQQLLQRPDASRWSIAECLSHLNVTAAAYQPFIDAAIRQGRENKVFGKGPFKAGMMGRFLVWNAEPPPKFRMRAPRKILPKSSITNAASVLADFMRVQDEWERQLQEMEGLNQQKLKCSSPFLLPRLRLAAPIPWMLAHQRRHLLQAEKVKAELQAKGAAA